MYESNQARAPGPVDVDAEMRQTQRTPIISVAAALGASAGVFALIMAFQLLDLFKLRGGWNWVPYLLLAYGVVSFVFGIKLFRRRVWAATGSTVMHVLAGLGTGFWFLLAAGSGFVSFAGLIVPPLALGAGVCSAVSIPQCIRTREARQRLAKAGMDVDF